MLPPDSSVVVGQFEDCEDDVVAEKVEAIPTLKSTVKVTFDSKKISYSFGDDSADDEYEDYEYEDDDDDMEEIRSKMTSMRAERDANQSAGKNRGTGGGGGGGGKGGGGVNDGGKNLKFLNKIFVGEYQPNSKQLTSKVANELNAANKPEKMRTKDKSHRATTEQVFSILVGLRKFKSSAFFTARKLGLKAPSSPWSP